MMETFINTSPIIFLEKLGLLDKIVPELWESIRITTAVIDEINDAQITNQPFFKKYIVQNRIAVLSMPAKLHRGESESIIGALETGIKLLIIDDSSARKKADSLGIKTIGTIGVLILASKRRIISIEEAIGYLHELRKNSFWISGDFFDEIIEKLKYNNL
jgi:predicted nucleic acid-binding protein